MAPPARVISIAELRTTAGISVCASAPWPFASKPTQSTALSAWGYTENLFNLLHELVRLYF